MSEPFLSEIRMVGFNFAPRGWAFCDGQILPINQNQSLYSLLGTTYGGDGRTSFGLPDLRGRVPMHMGATSGDFHPLGQKSGEETHTLSVNELPNHSHQAYATNEDATKVSPGIGGDRVLGNANSLVYSDRSDVTLNANTLANTGGGHENRQPYLVVNFCIALQGLFPSRN